MSLSTSPSEQSLGSLNELITSVRGNPLAATEKPYLLLDGARIKQVSELLKKLATDEWISLVGASLDTPLLDVSPILISPGGDDKQVARLLRQPKYRGAVLFIVSTAPLQNLADNLIRHLYINEQDGTRWMLAFWDPFILPSLVGCGQDVNALVPGPVLDPAQIGSLMATISCAVFQDREGRLQAIDIPATEGKAGSPFVLRQDQIDRLMDIPLPGQVAETLKALDGGNSSNETLLHSVCCDAIKNARRAGRDTLADYCETALELLSKKSPRRRQAHDT